MQERAPGSALGEWRRYGIVPIAAAFGYSTMAIQTFGIGPFVVPLEQEFGWSRAEVLSGLTISSIIGFLMNFAVGLVADRFGPRRVALAGVVVKAGGIALLATATGTVLNWVLLWLVVSFGAVLAQANVWCSAVASRFDKGRGLALAVALSGSSVCGAIAPLLGTWLILNHGWRTGFVGLGLVWLIVVVPVVTLFFRGRQDEVRDARKASPSSEEIELPGVTVAEGLRMSAFWKLLVTAFAFAFYTMSISPNLVPLMAEKGESATEAAALASLVGVVGIIARISTGFLLDHISARLLGTLVFLLPVAGCWLLVGDTVGGSWALALAVASFGITIGAEYDIAFYLVGQHFGLKRFAALMGGLLTAGATGAAFAPVVAGRLHDQTGTYDSMLLLLMGLMALGALAMASLGKPRQSWPAAH